MVAVENGDVGLNKVVPVREGRYAGVRGEALDEKDADGAQSAAVATIENRDKVPRRKARVINRVPLELLNDEALNKDIGVLPSNYNFEIHKTIHRIRTSNARRVALQMPEGLLMFACTISDIIARHAYNAETVVLGDVTYGACCVDDLTAKALGCDLLIHYGHSCLVSVKQCVIPTMYVFVHISFEPSHLVRCLKDNFDTKKKIALVGTIQFVDTLHALKPQLVEHFDDISIPQSRPLSPGELLGCTSPIMKDREVLVYVGDGRFHLESAMIANPNLPAYRYDPYSKKFTIEHYDHDAMRRNRKGAVTVAESAQRFGVILGTLGRQGSPKILERISDAIMEVGKGCVTILLSEISPQKIVKMEESGVDAWIQIACPRLSIDWGHGYGAKPLLNPYEAFVALGQVPWREEYPMDFYSKKGGKWTNYYDNSKAVSKKLQN